MGFYQNSSGVPLQQSDRLLMPARSGLNLCNCPTANTSKYFGQAPNQWPLSFQHAAGFLKELGPGEPICESGTDRSGGMIAWLRVRLSPIVVEAFVGVTVLAAGLEVDGVEKSARKWTEWMKVN